MRLLKTTRLFLTLIVMVWLSVNLLPVADGFIAGDHHNPRTRGKLNSLIRRVHKDQWVIGYVYAGPELGEPAGVCPPGARNNGAAIEETIETALRAWLQPVKDLNTGKPVVDDFRFVPNFFIRDAEALIKDENGIYVKDIEAKLQLYDLRIYFFCNFEKSAALTRADEAIPPAILMRKGTEVTPRFAGELLHELGHSFGLLDTYIILRREAEELRVSRGGLDRTIGHQPASVMSGFGTVHPPPTRVAKDDANGIVWLYKFYHENLPLEDCIFPDYELEKSPDGCRPKSPLLFEIKYGREILATRVIEEDEKTDVNARDSSGATALHYAAMKGYPKLMEKLLWHKDIEVNAKDAEGSTALFWAAKRGSYGVAERLVKHKAVDVNIRGAGGRAPLKEAETQKHKDIVALLLEQEQNEAAWREIDATSIANYRSVFYLLVPGPLLFHVGYLGTVLGGDALFVGQQREEDGIENLLDRDDTSLVGYEGLVAEDVNVREVASFAGTNGQTGSVLLAIRDVDFSAYAPLALSSYPNLRETDVELLTYKFGLDIMLKGEDRDNALNLPLRVRRCVSVPHAGLGALISGSTRVVLRTASRKAPFCLMKRTERILGFYRSQEGSEILGDGLPLADVVSEALMRLVDRKPVTRKIG